MYIIEQQQEDYRWIDNSTDTVIILSTQPVTGVNGQYYYFIDTDVVKVYSSTTGTFTPSLNYKVYVGRSNLKFQYIHNADYESRIDPGLTNLVDIFVLTKQYDRQYREWLTGSRAVQPLPPSSDAL